MGHYSNSELLRDGSTKSTMSEYMYFNRQRGQQRYLESWNFECSRLKFLCRTNALCLINYLNLFRLKDNVDCELSSGQQTEGLRHFYLECPALAGVINCILLCADKEHG